MSPGSSTWTTPSDVAARVRRRWESGELLRGFARSVPFEPVTVPVRGPRAGEIATDLAAVRDWVRMLEDGARHGRGPVYRLETRPVGGRAVGSNEVPVRAVVEDYETAWRLLGVEGEVRTYAEVLDLTRRRQPALVDWVCEHPGRVLALASVWPQVLEAAGWITANRGRGLYLRQIDAPGIDTKFVEQHRRVLVELVDVLSPRPPEVADGSDLAARWGFLTKPRYVRLRFDPAALDGWPGEVTEAALRVEELATLAPAADRVFIVENEVTYLALPRLAGSLVMFGAGYTVGVAGSVPWLAEREVVYWGDLDTHGFAILNRLRAHCPHTRSLLMDRSTLLAHRDRWGTEPSPTNAHLARLTAAESDLYQDLVEDTFGPAVRLEQERVAWPAVEDALAPYRSPVADPHPQEDPS